MVKLMKFIMLYTESASNLLTVCGYKFLGVIIQMKAIDYYFPMAPFFIFYKVVLGKRDTPKGMI